jgi:predicted polyphosphate/ATP-dependent NAD kinase
MSDLDKKDVRRQKFLDKNFKKDKVSEEQKFVAKNKKQLKRRMEDMKAEELWEDWENEIH